MEDSWRLHSIQAPNICPTCSISHFPFCPQPPPYDPPFNRPYFDPISYNRGYTDRMNDRFHRDFENDRALKRIRVGEIDSISAENERRLSLIRNHGAAQGPNGYSHPPRPPGHSFYDSISGPSQILHQESSEFGRKGYDLGYNVDDFRSEKERELMLYRKNEEGGKNSVFRSSYEHYSLNNDAPNYVNSLEEQQQYIHSLRHEPYLTAQESFSVYHGRDSNQLNQANEFLHSNAVNSPLYSGSGYERKQNLHFQNDVRLSYEVKYPQVNGLKPPVAPHDFPMLEHLGAPKINGQGGYMSPTGNSVDSFRQGSGVYPPLPPLPPPAAVGVYPPLPPLPPPSLPMEPPGPPPAHLLAKTSPPNIPLSSPDGAAYVHPSAIQGQAFPLRNPSPEKPKIIDASSLFKLPNRESRPDHIVVILRGLPGSGKSYVAKMLRDLEVENGANAPRIHSMDDYFMTEVEKVEESEGIKSSGLARGKKRVTKKVMEYCYEPEMEEAYRSSMLKAFKKTVEDGLFTFIIVDDRNLRVADFTQFWASAKRAGYEVYLLEAMYKDPVGCAARNIHGFTTEDIQKMAELWEEAPPLYMRLDIQSLFHGDDLKGNEIQEVDMDMDDVACDGDQSELPNRVKTMEQPDDSFDDSVKDEVRWNTEVDDQGVKELGRSKWSHDADEEDMKRSENFSKVSNALSGLIQAYAKGDKSVHWGDQVGKTGFSIGANRRSNVLSLVIGPGSGYNLKSNPLPEEENEGATDISWQSKKRRVFEEQLRAERASERESVKAAVDRRRQRIPGLAMDDEAL